MATMRMNYVQSRGMGFVLPWNTCGQVVLAAGMNGRTAEVTLAAFRSAGRVVHAPAHTH